MRLQAKLLGLASTVILASACGASQKTATPPSTLSVAKAPQEDTTAQDENQTGINASSSVTADVDGAASAPVFEPLYFEFDSTELQSSSMQTLQSVAEYMRTNKDVSVTIAGHADARGTAEYNLALGDRRAQAAKAYLVRLGVPGDRLKVLSYGAERPALMGEGEEVWAKNRRDEFMVGQAETRATPAND